MFLFDAFRCPVDDALDVFVDSKDYVPETKIPFQYTVKLNELVTDISRVELLDREVPTTSRYIFALPVPTSQTTAMARACVPGIVYSSFDGVVRPRALIVRLDDPIPNTESGSTVQRLAYALPFQGTVNPAFATDTTDLTITWNQPLIPSGSTTMTCTRGTGLTDAVFLRIENPPLEVKLSFGPNTVFRHAMTPAVHHDTFWSLSPVQLHFPTDVNINRYMRRAITSDYMNVMLLVDGEPYIPPFDIVYGSSPPQVLYKNHQWHFRLYFQRKTK
jgi:hypothetical protein